MNIQTIIVDIDLDFTSGEVDVHNNQIVEESKGFTYDSSADVAEAERAISRETKSYLNSKYKAQDIYEKIIDKNLEDKSELETIKSYQHALSNTEVNCKKIYIYQEDAEQAERLSLEIDGAIRAMK